LSKSDTASAGCHVAVTIVSKETYYSVKRDLLQCQKRPTTVSKATYYSVKRDLLQCVKRDLQQCQKRPTTVSKETYYSVKRDLLQCQKRPTIVSKETQYLEQIRHGVLPLLRCVADGVERHEVVVDLLWPDLVSKETY